MEGWRVDQSTGGLNDVFLGDLIFSYVKSSQKGERYVLNNKYLYELAKAKKLRAVSTQNSFYAYVNT